MTETKVVIDFWDLLLAIAGVLVAFCLVAWAFGSLLVGQFKDHLDTRFEARDTELSAMDRKLDEVEKHGRNIEGDLLRMRAELPNEYVRREDWIRFSGTIDSKLDALRGSGESLRTLVAALVEQIKGLAARSGSHGR